MQALLSFDRAPPYAAPLRFFLTAPLFLLAAGALLAVSGEEALTSRWSPAALATTHLVTIGFMLQVMLGALIQILPVVAGANLERPLQVARWVHGGLTLGTVLLVSAFLLSVTWLYQFAALCLLLTALLFIFAATKALRGIPNTSPTLIGIRCALLALLVLVSLGVLLAWGLAGGWGLPLAALTNLHAAWGLAGWAGILLAALAFVTVPMFQLTPPYPLRESTWLPLLAMGLLLLWTLLLTLYPDGVVFAELMWVAVGGSFLVYTLRLQTKRRRARADATFHFWRLGLLSLLLALLHLPLMHGVPAYAQWSGGAPLFGVLLGIGGFVSCMVGMLYKIIPFLAWLHLQQIGRGPAPNMGLLLAEKDQLRQYYLHLAATIGLVAAVLRPQALAFFAGILLMMDAAGLGWNLFLAARRYRCHAIERMQAGA